MCSCGLSLSLSPTSSLSLWLSFHSMPSMCRFVCKIAQASILSFHEMRFSSSSTELHSHHSFSLSMPYIAFFLLRLLFLVPLSSSSSFSRHLQVNEYSHWTKSTYSAFSTYNDITYKIQHVYFVRSALLSVKYKGREKKYFRLNARWQWRWMRWGESQVARQSVYKRKMDRKSIFMWLNDFDNGQIYAHILCICCCESARTHDNKCKYVAITSIILFFVRSEGEHRMKWQRERSTIVISKMFTLNFRFTRISTFSNGEKKNGKEK